MVRCLMTDLRKITGKIYNAPDIKPFWCKRCKKAVDTIYKDEKGNSYCDNCKEVKICHR